MKKIEMKPIPEGMTLYSMTDGNVVFTDGSHIIGTGFDKRKRLTRIGSYNVMYLKEVLEKADLELTSSEGNEEIVIYIDDKDNSIGPMRVGQYFIAPRIKVNETILNVKVKKQKRKK